MQLSGYEPFTDEELEEVDLLNYHYNDIVTIKKLYLTCKRLMKERDDCIEIHEIDNS